MKHQIKYYTLIKNCKNIFLKIKNWIFKEQIFYKTLEESGIKLEEPEFIERFDQTPGLDYDNKDFYHNRQNKPFPPDLNKLKIENEN